MRYPAYIYFEENGDFTEIQPVFFDSEEDAKWVGETLLKINKMMLTTGYEVEVKKQNE